MVTLNLLKQLLSAKFFCIMLSTQQRQVPYMKWRKKIRDNSNEKFTAECKLHMETMYIEIFKYCEISLKAIKVVQDLL